MNQFKEPSYYEGGKESE